MLHNKQKVVTGMSIMIIVAILTFGSSSYSLVSAISSQSSVDHHKASVKKQESRSDANDDRSSKDKGNAERNDKVGTSSGSSQGDSSDTSSSTSNSDTEGSDNSNNVGDTEKNNNSNNQATDDGSNTGIGENVPSIVPAIPAPHRSCDQGSNCNDQQDPSNTDHPTAATPTKRDSTPFVLSLPFP